MRIIVDTNIIISALIKDSVSRTILLHPNGEFYTISFSREEVEKYRAYILRKANITEDDFVRIFEKIMNTITVLDDRVVQSRMDDAKQVMDGIDSNDTPFIAAALAINALVWSEDKHFAQQKKVRIITTKELFQSSL